MAVRTQEISGRIINGAGVAQAGITVTAQLLVPSGARAVSSAGEVIDPLPLTAQSDSTGAYDFGPANTPPNGLIPPGDIYQYSGGLLISLPGCAWQIRYLSSVIVSPAFGYSSSPIDPATWLPPITTIGLLKMDLGVILGNAQPDQGVSFTVALSADSFWTGGSGAGQLINSASSFQVQTDAAGKIYTYLIRQSELAPSDGYYVLTKAGATGLTGPITFTCPTAYTGDAGVWNNGTTYGIGAVVRDPATDEPYISLSSGNVGHAPASSPGFWSDYPGEPIRPALAMAGTTQIATESAIATGGPQVRHRASPATLLDDLEEALYQLAILRLRGPAGTTTLGSFGVFV